MDRYEELAFSITGVIIMIFLFATLWSSRASETALPDCVPYDIAYTKPKVTQIDKSTYQVFYVAKMWVFQPSTIRLPVGSEVDFFLTSQDVVHGVHIVDKNVNMMAVYGAVNKVTINFDKPGVYKVVCHEYCGAGHQQMQGEIIVNYPKSL